MKKFHVAMRWGVIPCKVTHFMTKQKEKLAGFLPIY